MFVYELGKLAKDKVTGFKGIIVGRIEYLFGCNQYGLLPQKIKEDGDVINCQYFDEGRIVILGKGILPVDVKANKPGAVFNRDVPR